MIGQVRLVTILGVLVALGGGGSGCRKPTERPTPVPTERIRQDRPSQTAEPPELQFSDLTEKAGIIFRHHSGAEAGHLSILESVGSGVALLDYDGDGLLDLFFPGGGSFEVERILGKPGALFRQVGDLQFRDESGPAGDGFPSPRFTHGCAVADFDNDGFLDILVTGYGGVQLWRNLGDGTFEEHHLDAGLSDSRWSTAAGWGDVDGDGDLDLYIVHYVNWSFENHPRCRALGADEDDICPPEEFAPLADTLWMSNGDGTFRQAAFDTGLRADGKGLGVVLADLDDDGHLDIYVANDSTDNFFYRNDGFGGFIERADRLHYFFPGFG